MQWNDNAIVLSVRRLGEHSGLIHLLTSANGLHAGVDKAALGKRRQGMYQPGNYVSAHWQARLSEHVGTFSCELTRAVAAMMLDSRPRLAALTSATQLVEKILPERDPHPEIYLSLHSFLDALCEEGQAGWLKHYVLLEYALLECAGFGLDLSSCAATGQTEDLCYVSPRSGRAVSRGAGMPYHDRLLVLPSLLCNSSANQEYTLDDLLHGIRLCGYFLHNRVFSSRGQPMPRSREHFMQALAVA